MDFSKYKLTFLECFREYHLTFFKVTNFEKQQTIILGPYLQRYLWLLSYYSDWFCSCDDNLYFSCFQGVPSLFSDLSPLYDHPGKVNLHPCWLFYKLSLFIFLGPREISTSVGLSYALHCFPGWYPWATYYWVGACDSNNWSIPWEVRCGSTYL